MSVINNAINGSILITTFTSSGTWTINARTKSVTIIGCNGGSGGGSGRKGTSGSTWGGGGGGGGGSLEYRLPIFLFGSSSYSVTIGGGGTGGAAQTTNATNGITGGDVGLTIVGNLKGAPATGNGGTGGRNSSSSSYGGTYYSGAGYSTGFAGFGGFGSNTNAGAPGTGGLYNAGGFYGTGGGGGAGGSTLQAYQGGASGAIFGCDLTTVLIAGSAGGIQSGTINGSDGTAGSTTTGLDGKFKAGTGGGGGGGYYSSGTGGAGGNGAVPGGAGGGGGGGISSSGNSGKGGDGAKGALFIIEYF